MSVSTYTATELVGFYRRYEAIREQHSLHDAPPCTEFRDALQAALFANMTAYYLCYPQAWEDGGPDIENFEAAVAAEPVCRRGLSDGDARMLVRELRLLVYNTVMNNGTHCLPRPYEETLEFAGQCIADSLAMIYAAA